MSDTGLLYGGMTEDEFAQYLEYYIECIPAPQRIERDLLERYLYWTAKDLSQMLSVFLALPNYINPATAPEPWLRWMISEWWGFYLIPDGYPIDRVRRLLANLNIHYKRRYTKIGIKGLLNEFGISCEVYDDGLFVGGWIGSRGTRHPLHVRIIIHGYEAFDHPKNTFIGNFIGGGAKFVYSALHIITEDFVKALVHWNRGGAIQALIEWRMGHFVNPLAAPLLDDDDVLFP